MSKRKKNESLTSSLKRYINSLDRMEHELSPIEQVPTDIKSKIHELKSEVEQLHRKLTGEIKQIDEETSDSLTKMSSSHPLQTQVKLAWGGKLAGHELLKEVRYNLPDRQIINSPLVVRLCSSLPGDDNTDPRLGYSRIDGLAGDDNTDPRLGYSRIDGLAGDDNTDPRL